MYHAWENPHDNYILTTSPYGFVWKGCVPHCTQWFCWSLSLLNGYFIGGIPHFQTYPYGNIRFYQSIIIKNHRIFVALIQDQSLKNLPHLPPTLELPPRWNAHSLRLTADSARKVMVSWTAHESGLRIPMKYDWYWLVTMKNDPQNLGFAHELLGESNTCCIYWLALYVVYYGQPLSTDSLFL